MATIRSSTPAHSIHETTGISSPCRKSVPPFPGAPGKPLEGRNVPKPCSLPRRAMIRRATLKRFCPAGQTASTPRTGSAPCPTGARQRRPTHAFAGGRPLLVGLPPSAPTTALSEPKRSAPITCSWQAGASFPWRRRSARPERSWKICAQRGKYGRRASSIYSARSGAFPDRVHSVFPLPALRRFRERAHTCAPAMVYPPENRE